MARGARHAAAACAINLGDFSVFSRLHDGHFLKRFYRFFSLIVVDESYAQCGFRCFFRHVIFYEFSQ